MPEKILPSKILPGRIISDKIKPDIIIPGKKKIVRVGRLGKKRPANSPHPDYTALSEAGKIICNQGIVIFPTQCLYGVAVNALDPKAIQKIFNIKQRSQSNPILVLIQAPKDLKDLVKTIPDSAQILMEQFWPGNLTLIFEAATQVSPLLTAHTGKIGIRLPTHPIACALLKQVQRPITGTSANLSGQPGCNRVTQLPPAILKGSDLILDAGPLKGGPGSSIVDVTTDPVCILRQGTITAQKIHQALFQAKS